MIGKRFLAATGAAAVAAGALVAVAPAAVAAPVAVGDATFRWGLSAETGGGAFLAGTCNFLSAGTAGDSGSARLWTAGDVGTLYRSTDGNTRIVKPNASGADTAATFGTRCQDRNGATVTSSSTTSTSENQVVIDNGVGTIDVAANTASIQWTGSFTSVFYSGLNYWTAVDPVLTVNADGTGTITATGTGYAADRVDTGKWEKIADTPITLANLVGVDVAADGMITTPVYKNVAVTVPSGSAAQNTSVATWGSFPQSFVDFQGVVGAASYWYSSGGQRDAAKPALPVVVGIGPTPIASAVSTGIVLAASSTRSVVGANVRLTATVSPSSAGGSVTFKDGSRVLRTVALSSGRALLDTRALSVNPHSLRAVFNPSNPAAFTTSTSAPRPLTVVKAKATASLKLAKKKIRKSKKPVVTVKVALAGTTLRATGKITVKVGKKTLKSATLRNGSVKVTLGKRKAGTYKLYVVYAGNANAAKATSKKVTLKVVK